MPIVKFKDGTYLGDLEDGIIYWDDNYISTPSGRATRILMDQAIPYLRDGNTVQDPHDLTKKRG